MPLAPRWSCASAARSRTSATRCIRNWWRSWRSVSRRAGWTLTAAARRVSTEQPLAMRPKRTDVDSDPNTTLDSVVAASQRSFALKIGGPAELTLVRPDGSEHAVHPLWLRERCQDAASIDLKTQQRLQDPSDFDPDLRLLAVSQPSPGVFRVRFSDGHEASFEARDILAEAALAPNSHDCPA